MKLNEVKTADAEKGRQIYMMPKKEGIYIYIYKRKRDKGSAEL